MIFIFLISSICGEKLFENYSNQVFPVLSLPVEHAIIKTEKRLPDALVYGIRKAGTRAILEFLRIHFRISKL